MNNEFHKCMYCRYYINGACSKLPSIFIYGVIDDIIEKYLDKINIVNRIDNHTYKDTDLVSRILKIDLVQGLNYNEKIENQILAEIKSEIIDFRDNLIVDAAKESQNIIKDLKMDIDTIIEDITMPVDKYFYCSYWE